MGAGKLAMMIIAEDRMVCMETYANLGNEIVVCDVCSLLPFLKTNAFDGIEACRASKFECLAWRVGTQAGTRARGGQKSSTVQYMPKAE